MSVLSSEHFFLHGFWSSPLRLHSPVDDCLVGALMPRLSIIVGVTREMKVTLDPSSPVLMRGGGWRLPQFHRRRSSFREEEAQSVPSSPAFDLGGRDFVQTIELSGGKPRQRRRAMVSRRLSSLGAPAKRGDGGKCRWLCEDGTFKSRRATRGGRMSQILTCVKAHASLTRV
ncbi:hypothetical protein HID58_032657 [Brassica napus]|uniref:Uncharacterized protein n=1 Tax=Brassica napus TaxID=3708 RepID=A0ABQ8BYR5_BRANA|nr:hypothetical protein HID58_032657 [Brassica napus]